MKRTLSLCLVACVGSSAFANYANSDFHAFMLKTLPQVEHAFNTKNADWFSTMSTANFVDVEQGRVTPGPAAIKQMKQQFQMVQSMDCHFKLISTSVSGPNYIANTTGHAVMVMKAQGKAKPQRITIDMVEKETWVRIGNSWKMSKLESPKPPKMTMG